MSWPLPPPETGTGSSTPLPPVRNELSSKKSPSGIDTNCQPVPLTAHGPVGGDHAVELELVVGRVRGQTDRVVSVVVVLEVDLEGVVLPGVGVDPEIEVVHTGQVDRIGSTEPSEEARDVPPDPQPVSRDQLPAGSGARSVLLAADAATPTEPLKKNHPLPSGIAVLHVVEHHRRPGRGRGGAGGGRQQGKCHHERQHKDDGSSSHRVSSRRTRPEKRTYGLNEAAV